jgi:hypothetical protein
MAPLITMISSPLIIPVGGRKQEQKWEERGDLSANLLLAVKRESLVFDVIKKFLFRRAYRFVKRHSYPPPG